MPRIIMLITPPGTHFTLPDDTQPTTTMTRLFLKASLSTIVIKLIKHTQIMNETCQTGRDST